MLRERGARTIDWLWLEPAIAELAAIDLREHSFDDDVARADGGLSPRFWARLSRHLFAPWSPPDSRTGRAERPPSMRRLARASRPGMFSSSSACALRYIERGRGASLQIEASFCDSYPFEIAGMREAVLRISTSIEA